MATKDHRDKVIRLWTLRQEWPRNAGNVKQQPKWQRIKTRSPFASNLKYKRPRSLDHTNIN